MPKRRLILFLILFGAIGFVVYRAFFQNRATNFILISIDTLRPDHLGCYGYPLDQPNLSKLRTKAWFSIAHIQQCPQLVRQWPVF